MANLIRNTLLACGVAMAASTLCAPSAFAAEAKKPVAKAKAKVTKAKVVVDDDTIKPTTPEDEPDVGDKHSVEFNCELGNKVTVYSNEVDTSSIALHRLTQVGTTTGAKRYENQNFGLIWIGIPSKGMLLDSKLNRQLANECKNTEQENPIVKAPAKADLIAPLGKVIVEPAIPPAALAPAALPLLPVPGTPAVITPPAITPVGSAPVVPAPVVPAPVAPAPPATPAPVATPPAGTKN
jgi:hypothetical protein